ncbi:MAG: AAA family ATPase [Candidatus Lokiarchaeota archaeon]|nr:AAA family ATPase [Candidatus Lokiarchaeota archaeon]
MIKMPDKCKYLEEKEIVGETFYSCKMQEKGISSDYVSDFCINNWRDCKYVFIPSKSHQKGKWNEIIGLDDIKKELIQKVQHPFLFSQIKDIKIKPVDTIILFGPDGCQKTKLIYALAEESKANLEIISFKQIDELNSKIEEINENTPTIILINEVDLIAPPIESKQVYMATFRIQDPIVSLMAAITKIKSSDKLISLIMITDNPDIVSPLILKQEYISDILYIHPPSEGERREIIKKILKNKPFNENMDFKFLSKKTNNFSAQDLYKMARIAELKWAEDSYEKERKIKMEDLQSALDEIVPSLTKSLIQKFELNAIRYGSMEKKFGKEKLTWKDLGGYDSIKNQMQNIISMLTSKDMYEKYDVKAPTGVLLFGPPGCGKTYIAKILAETSKANFLYASAPDLLSKWLGESEQKIRDLFISAKLNPPSIIFFDELDGIAFERSRTTDHPYLTTILSTLLSELSDLSPEDHVLVIGATNRIDDIDSAFLRPGRLDERIAVPPPDQEARKKIFQIHLKKVKLDNNVDFDLLSKKTQNYTGAEIAYICDTTKRNKAIKAIETGNFSKIDMKDVLDTLNKVKPDLSSEDIEEFNEMIEKFERRGRFPVEIIREPVYWEDIGGLHDIKEFLINHVVQPLIHHKKAYEFGITPKKGIIFYGLPGCAKTSLAKAITTASNANLFRFSALELTNIFLYQHNIPKNFRNLLRDAERVAPSIVLLENVEAIDSLEVAMFIQSEIEKIKKEVPLLFICETINFEGIPEILKESNQIQYVIIIKPPDKQERQEIIRLKTKKLSLKEDFNFIDIAEKTKYYTGSDLDNLTKEAAHIAFTRKLNNQNKNITVKINENDFIEAMEIVGPSLSFKKLEAFKKSVDRIQKNKTRIGYYG